MGTNFINLLLTTWRKYLKYKFVKVGLDVEFSIAAYALIQPPWLFTVTISKYSQVHATQIVVLLNRGTPALVQENTQYLQYLHQHPQKASLKTEIFSTKNLNFQPNIYHFNCIAKTLYCKYPKKTIDF